MDIDEEEDARAQRSKLLFIGHALLICHREGGPFAPIWRSAFQTIAPLDMNVALVVARNLPFEVRTLDFASYNWAA